MIPRQNCSKFLCREESSEKRFKKCVENDFIDSKFGFTRLRDATEKVGFLLNMHVVSTIICIVLIIIVLVA